MIDENVKIGSNCKILHPELVNIYGCEIGNNVTIGAFVEICKNVVIGDNCKIQSHCFIAPGTEIKSNVFIGPGTIILNDKYPPSKGLHYRKVIVEIGAKIGGGCTILPGVTIGEGCTIGAGSVVTKSVKPYEIVAGNPSRKIK